MPRDSLHPIFALGTLPAGNLYSSMNELSHFLIAMLNGGQFEDKSVIERKCSHRCSNPLGRQTIA